MSSDLNLQNNTALIHQSLKEVHILLSALEEQAKLGLFPTQHPSLTQQESEIGETIMLKEQLSTKGNSTAF